MTAVGSNVPRKDGPAKVKGQALYVDDLSFPGMLHGRTVRSTVSRGRIVSIDTSDAGDGFTVVDSSDIPGENCIALIETDQPCLAEAEVRHFAEPVLLLAHADKEKLWNAAVEIQYEAAAPVLDYRLSSEVCKELHIDKGSLEKGFAEADLIVEGEYGTGHQEQLYIEPNGVIAVPEHGGVAIYGSLQCPYYVHKALMRLLKLPGDKIRVVGMDTGGGFGGKEEYPSMISAHAALLALKSGRPVKLVYDRGEDMLATTKRHPSTCRIRAGVKKDGRLTALDIDVLIDAGAYVTLSPVVLSRGVIHAAGPYRCDHVRIVGRAVLTNTPPNGAFRGFGAPQTLFAMEVHMERIADRLALDPVSLREINALRTGDTNATGQLMKADCSALPVLREAVRRTRFREKRKAWEGSDRGIGLSLICHGSGFTGIGEVYLASEASLELTETGVRVLVASTEIGQGTRTMHAQIVADALGIPYEQVETANPDTARVPDSGPTVASRTCMVVGGILKRCAEEMRRRIGESSPADYYRSHGPLRITEKYRKPEGLEWDETTYKGDAYATYAWACIVAEVDRDPDTYEIRPLKLTAVQDIGQAIHPVMARGQIEGGSAQGVGFAVLENVVMADGRMANPQMTNYLVPTTLDTPEMDVVFVNAPYSGGPYGAKGIGELPIDGPAPAIVNAIRHLGIDLRSVPATPEKIMELQCVSD